MAGFASIIDALGGLTVDVGPERIPIGGITPSGRLVRPDGYIEPGIQQLTGEQALAFARSRTGTTDYARMGRQRCLLQNILTQKSPTDLLANFQGVASATTNSVSTNIPQAVLPALAALARRGRGLAGERVVRPEPARPVRGRRQVQDRRPELPVHAPGRAGRHQPAPAPARSPRQRGPDHPAQHRRPARCR